MKEYPILFDAESMRANLALLKTQTRRTRGLDVINEAPDRWRLWHGEINGMWAFTDHPTQGEKGNIINVRCPYGQVGDRIWGRETFWTPGEIPNPPLIDTGDYIKSPNGWAAVVYRADGDYDDGAWKPSIFMPRWACRFVAEIVSERVGRVLPISDEDIQAEGVQPIMVDSGGVTPWGEPIEVENYIDPWIERWDTINTKPGRTSEDNPWVWIIEYRQVRS